MKNYKIELKKVNPGENITFTVLGVTRTLQNSTNYTKVLLYWEHQFKDIKTCPSLNANQKNYPLNNGVIENNYSFLSRGEEGFLRGGKSQYYFLEAPNDIIWAIKFYEYLKRKLEENQKMFENIINNID